MDRTLIGVGVDEVSIIPFVYPRGTVSVSSLCYFSYVGSSSKLSRSSLPLYLAAHHFQDYFKKKRWGKQKCIKSQRYKANREEQRNQMMVTVQAKLVVGFGELVPMESGSYNSAEQDTATVTKENE